jgi:hypothetical protein
MNNILALYYDDHDCTPEEMNRLIREMEECIWGSLTPEQAEEVEQEIRSDHLLTLPVLERALCRTAESISAMRNGHHPIQPITMRTLALLHARVVHSPELARLAISDFMARKEAAQEKN